MTAPDVLLAGRYRLVSRLAAGGMGSVWEAWDEVLQRPVAVKQLLHQPGLRPDELQIAADRAMREARITARLHHPHAVPVYDVVEHDGRPCLIMQYVPSRTLQEILNDKGVLQPAVVAGIGAEVAGALAAAHQAGIVHRDVKPSNVLITEDGSAKLTDFGVSHAVGDVSLTSTGMVTGTPGFLAPEVARGAESDAAADVFSLGSTLYAALEGAPPFGTDDNPMALLHRVASGQPNPPRASGALAPLLTRMLAADPADRPPMTDVSHTLAALRADLGAMGEPTQRIAVVPPGRQHPTTRTAAYPGPPPPVAPPPVRPGAAAPVRPGAAGAAAAEPASSRRRTALIATAVVLALGAAILVAVMLMNGGGGTPQAGPPQPSKRSSSRPARTTAASSSRPPSTTAASSPAASSPAQSSSSAASSSQSAPQAGPTGAQLARAIVDYYALLPANTDAGWARLTTRYQQTTAKSRQAYQTFWDSVERIDVSGATGTPPDGAQAVLTYTYKDGRVVRELTSFRLVQSDGILKIDESSVLSSQTL